MSNLTIAKHIVYRYIGSASTVEIVFGAKDVMPHYKQADVIYL